MNTNQNKDQSANKPATTERSPMAANEANANKSSADSKDAASKDKPQSKEQLDAEAAKKAKEAGKNAA